MAIKPNATLQEIVQRCFGDPSFFERLVQDANGTLKAFDLVLPDAERTALEQMIGNVGPADVFPITELVRGFRALSKDEWRPGWPMGWVPYDRRRRDMR